MTLAMRAAVARSSSPDEARAEYLERARELSTALSGTNDEWRRACARFDAFVLKQPFVQLGLSIQAFVARRTRPVPPGQEEAA